jgi:nicotinamidase-related amidase
MLIEAGKASLLVIDMQERLLAAMAERSEAERRCATLIKAAKTLEMPVVASEQYPKGLGRTVAGIAGELGNSPVFEKLAFSCWRDDAIKSHLIGLHETGRPQVIVCGVEAHVCVLQTACDLAQAGFAVFAAADAMTARQPSSVALALDRMRQNGAAVVNTEMAVFELLGRAGTSAFKELTALIK